MRRWHSGLSGATIPAKSYRLLRALLNTAVDDEMIGRNPCRVQNGGVERSPERPLPTGDEVWALADAIEPRYRALILIAAFVGLRRGELAALRRGDIDLEDRVVHVERQTVEIGSTIMEGPPKSAAGIRAVAMPPVLVAEIMTHLDTYVAPGRDALVFTGAMGAQVRGTNFNKVFGKARDEIGRPNLHLHDLRHYANTLAASAGASTRELMARLGHASPAAALRYQHATAERDQVVADRMSDLITGTSSGVELRVLKGWG